jgi:hypothetical protein
MRRSLHLCALFACVSSSFAQSPFPLPIPTRPSLPLAIPTLPSYRGYVGAIDGWRSTVPGRAQGSIVLIKGAAALDENGQAYALDANLSWLSLPQGLVDVAGYGNALLALTAQGEVLGFGSVYNAADGSTKTLEELIPAEISAKTIVAICHDYSSFLALTTEGQVISWGAPTMDYTVSPPIAADPTPVPPDAQSGVVSIAMAGEHRLALKESGQVVAWGRVADSVDENPTTPNYPTLNFVDASSILPPEVNTGVVAIAAGPNNGLALKEDGSVVQWGKQVASYYGVRASVTELQPVPSALADQQVVAISGSLTSLVAVVTSMGDVYQWGISGMQFQLNSSVLGKSVVQVAAGSYGDTTYYLSLSDRESFSDITGFPLERLAQLVAQEILAHTNNYGLATKPDLLSAVQQAAADGEQQGIASVQSAPNSFNLYSSTQYEANRITGVAEGKAEVTSNPASYNLYTSASIMDLRMNGAMVQKHGETATVVFQPQTTMDLATQPFTDSGPAITNEIPMPGDKGFLRIQAKPE